MGTCLRLGAYHNQQSGELSSMSRHCVWGECLFEAGHLLTFIGFLVGISWHLFLVGCLFK